MAVIYTEHFAQFFDDNGDPLSGGKLYAYSAGTTTPKATYTTAAATVENPNPIILDSAGRATIFIQGSYRFDLYDANDVLIKSTDDVTSFTTLNESGEPFFQSFSGTGAQTVFTLSESLGDDSKDILVWVDAGGNEGYEIQNPSAFTLSGTSLTFNTAPASGTDNIYVFAPTKLLGAAAASAASAAADAASTAASKDLAEDWAVKDDGIVDSTDYSAKAYAIGGTGVTDTAGKGAAKEWAIETSGTVDGTDYSAKEYAQGTQASTGGSAKNWAQQTGADVTGAATNSRSAKSWAQDVLTGATLGGSAKDWAQTAEDTLVNGSEYSALHYSAKASASATAAAASAAKLSGTSTTSVAIGTGSKAFTTQADKSFDVGVWLLIVSDADEANYMHGQVTAYSGTSLTVNVTNVGGSGTFADWNITVSGTRGATGAQGPAGNIGDIGGLPSATITASDEIPFADVDDSNNSKKTTLANFVTSIDSLGTFLAAADNLSDLDNASTARTNLGVAIGSDVQAYDADLAAIAALVSAANKIIRFTGSGTADLLDFLDEDNMASDSATALASQQSIKAYVDANAGGSVTVLGNSTSGGLNLPDGTQIRYGFYSGTIAGGATQAVSWHTAFSTECSIAAAFPSAGAAQSMGRQVYATFSTSAITIGVPAASASGTDFYYVGIGR